MNVVEHGPIFALEIGVRYHFPNVALQMFSDLPVELLQCIFMLLSPCTDLLTVLNVCRRWREVGQSVFKLRESLSLSAFKMQRPLQWVSPQLASCTERFKHTSPSKRFGATIILKEQLLYVFGGATKELTAFNDLWTYDLSTFSWQRLIGKGQLTFYCCQMIYLPS